MKEVEEVKLDEALLLKPGVMTRNNWKMYLKSPRRMEK